MTDLEMARVIRQKYPEMSNEAAKRMVFDWRWEAMPGKGRSPVPMPKNDVGVLSRVEKVLEKYLPRGSRKTAIEMLNESAAAEAWRKALAAEEAWRKVAEEAAWEARVS